MAEEQNLRMKKKSTETAGFKIANKRYHFNQTRKDNTADTIRVAKLSVFCHRLPLPLLGPFADGTTYFHHGNQVRTDLEASALRTSTQNFRIFYLKSQGRKIITILCSCKQPYRQARQDHSEVVIMTLLWSG